MISLFGCDVGIHCFFFSTGWIAMCDACDGGSQTNGWDLCREARWGEFPNSELELSSQCYFCSSLKFE